MEKTQDFNEDVIYPRLEDIILTLSANKLIPKDLHKVILKYFKPSIKVENKDGKISYFTQDQLNSKQFSHTGIVKVDICGILELKNPVEKFARSTIHSINGHVILSGYVSGMFGRARFFDKNLSKFDTSDALDMSYMFDYELTRWESLKDLKKKYKDLKTAGICMFASPRGANEGKICGKRAIPTLNQRVFTHHKYLDARCHDCAGKIGMIKKLMRA